MATRPLPIAAGRVASLSVDDLEMEGFDFSGAASEVRSAYSWLGEATVRVLTDMTGEDEPAGRGAFGIAMLAEYRGTKYVVKLSAEQHVDRSPAEGMIGAYLYAPPDMDGAAQAAIAVPRYRHPELKANADPFLHVADYYGFMVLPAGEAVRSLGALMGVGLSKTWREVLVSVAGKKWTLVQIVEYFEGGTLSSVVRKTVLDDERFRGLPEATRQMSLAYTQLALTLMALKPLGFAHADLHEDNIFCRQLREELSKAIYFRGGKGQSSLYSGGSGSLYAMGDLGESIAVGLGQDRRIRGHPAGDLHYLALRLVGLVLSVTPTFLEEEALAHREEVALGYETVAAFIEEATLFMFEPSEARALGKIREKLVLSSIAAIVTDLRRLVAHVLEAPPGSSYPGNLPAEEEARTAAINKLQGLPRPIDPPDKAPILDAALERQEKLLDLGKLRPRGMAEIPPGSEAALARTKGLVRPLFGRGDKKHWKKEPQTFTW